MKISDKNVMIAATGFYSGYSPIIPGTAGSLAAIPVCLVIMMTPVWISGILLTALIISSLWICGKASEILGKEDPGCIVLDEIAGMAVTMFGVSPDFMSIIAGFLLFRFFDILKPWPVRNFETLFGGGTGIVADDLAAGIYASISLNILILMGII